MKLIWKLNSMNIHSLFNPKIKNLTNCTLRDKQKALKNTRASQQISQRAIRSPMDCSSQNGNTGY